MEPCVYQRTNLLEMRNKMSFLFWGLVEQARVYECVFVLLTFFVSPVLSVYLSRFLREHKTTKWNGSLCITKMSMLRSIAHSCFLFYSIYRCLYFALALTQCKIHTSTWTAQSAVHWLRMRELSVHTLCVQCTLYTLYTEE